MDLSKYDITQYAIDNLSKGLHKKLDDYLIEGLKRKGFEFKNRMELEAFIKERCRCEDYPDLEERTYFVDDIPFFFHRYKTEIALPKTEDRKMTITASAGYFSYL
ncbi:MAG: hypothetical protein JJE55_06985 [Flavobacteriaceae bacterium]|nr:hypothetical protein [Flavobacteriaceae bacterium]